jgi:hypothetical protein
MHLINDNTDRIRTEFESWKKVPESVRGDAAATDRYVHMLVTIANVFERGGDRSRRALLEGNRQRPMADSIVTAYGAQNSGASSRCASSISHFQVDERRIGPPGSWPSAGSGSHSSCVRTILP